MLPAEERARRTLARPYSSLMQSLQCALHCYKYRFHNPAIGNDASVISQRRKLGCKSTATAHISNHHSGSKVAVADKGHGQKGLHCATALNAENWNYLAPLKAQIPMKISEAEHTHGVPLKVSPKLLTRKASMQCAAAMQLIYEHQRP